MLVPDYLWQFVFSALKCKLFQLSSAPYPVGRGGCSIGFGGGETSRGYVLHDFLEGCVMQGPWNPECISWSAAFL